MGISTSTGTLTAGQSRTFNLAPASAVTLTLLPNARVTITESPAIVTATGLGGNATRVHEPRLPGTFTYGPYPMGGSVLVENESNSGSSVAWSETSALFAKDTSGNVTGLAGSRGSVSLTNSLRGGSRRNSGKPILRSPANTTGLILSSNVTAIATTRRNRPCWEVTFPAETANKSVYFPITSRTYTDKVHATIEVEDASEWNGGSWRLALFTNINLNVGMRYVQTVGSANAWNGVHCLSPLASEWAAVGAGSFSNTMTYCAFQAVRKASPTGTTKVWIYEIAEADKQTLPSIVIGADDGHGTWYTDGLPIVEKYGFSSYLAYIHDSALAGGTSMTVAQWQDAVARGHHAVVHGCKSGVASLRDYFSTYTGYATPQAAMEADIAYNRDGMVGNDLDPDGRGRRVYVLPQGNHQPSGGAGDNTIMNALAAVGMTSARRASVENGLIINGGWAGARMYLPIIGHSYAGGSEATNITNLVTALQNEVNAGRSVVFMFHTVRASPTVAEDISPANLETLVSAANDLVVSGAARRGSLTDLADELGTYTSPVHVGQ